MNSTLCTISMRGGSQGVKNKNFKLINGKPLMYFTIKQAIKSRIFDHIVVSTDSKKILRIAKSYGADGWFLRPKKLSLNSSQKIPVLEVKAKTLIEKFNYKEGKELGIKLKEIEKFWIKNSFKISDKELNKIVKN